MPPAASACLVGAAGDSVPEQSPTVGWLKITERSGLPHGQSWESGVERLVPSETPRDMAQASLSV